MSYEIHAYLVDGASLKKLYGSNNKAALAKITGIMRDDLDDLDDLYEDHIDDTRNAEAVLTDIVNAEARFPALGALYAYVYEKLCARFGKQFFPPDDEFSTAYYEQVEKPAYPPFMPLPAAEGAPVMYTIAKEDMNAAMEKFLAPAGRAGTSTKEFETEKKDFEALFQKALADKKDVVFFLY